MVIETLDVTLNLQKSGKNKTKTTQMALTQMLRLLTFAPLAVNSRL